MLYKGLAELVAGPAEDLVAPWFAPTETVAVVDWLLGDKVVLLCGPDEEGLASVELEEPAPPGAGEVVDEEGLTGVELEEPAPGAVVDDEGATGVELEEPALPGVVVDEEGPAGAELEEAALPGALLDVLGPLEAELVEFATLLLVLYAWLTELVV